MDPKKLKVADLRSELERRGVNVTGLLKPALVAKLEESLAADAGSSTTASGVGVGGSAPTPEQVRWRGALAAGLTIRVTVGRKVWPVRAEQLAVLSAWARGDAFDAAWLLVDPATGAPTHFVSQDGKRDKLSIDDSPAAMAAAAAAAPGGAKVTVSAAVAAAAAATLGGSDGGGGSGTSEVVAIGSFAFAYGAPGALGRSPGDVDLVATSAWAAALLKALAAAGALHSHSYDFILFFILNIELLASTRARPARSLALCLSKPPPPTPSVPSARPHGHPDRPLFLAVSLLAGGATTTPSFTSGSPLPGPTSLSRSRSCAPGSSHQAPSSWRQARPGPA